MLKRSPSDISRFAREIEAGQNGRPPTSKQAGLIVRRASEIMPKPIAWLWPDRIARGKVSLIAGNPGLGKSQITAYMSAIVSTGGKWPEGGESPLGNVVILSAEDDHADTIRPRLDAAGADPNKCYIVEAVVAGHSDDTTRRRAFNLEDDLGRLSDTLTEIGETRLIIIDPITAYLGGADSHRTSDIRALLAPLADLAAAHGAAVVCISHLNKSASADPMARITGSMAFIAASRAGFLVAEDRDDPDRRLFLFTKNNLSKARTGLAFRIVSVEQPSSDGMIETSRIEWLPGVVSITAEEALSTVGGIGGENRSALDEACEVLRDILADGPVPFREVWPLAENTGVSKRTLDRAKKKLGVRSDKHQSEWLWSLPPSQECQDSQLESLATLATLAD